MCEILLRIIDRSNGDPYSDASAPKAGYAVTIQADGWPWSNEERTNSFWRIIATPGVLVSDFAQLLITESAQRKLDNPTDPLADPAVNRMLRRRAWGITISALPTNVKNTLLAARTGNGVLTVPKTTVTNVVTRLTAIADPAVIG